MAYLLDSDALLDLLRNPQGKVAQRIQEVGASEIATSILVVAELRHLIQKRSSQRLSERLGRVLAAIPVLDLGAPVDVYYAQIRTELSAARKPQDNRLLIAAHALALARVLVTTNEREFSRVEGLKVENWLR